MCGIAGYIDLNGPTDLSIADQMARALSHRGPDEQRWVSIGPARLAHARLSIIDLAASHQPMCHAGSGLVFNGELYNYKALRQSLKAPCAGWNTSGDTEVLLHLLLQRGVDGLQDIEGMFAFALWEDGPRRLSLGRDFFGKKPLYYATPRQGLIVFASEPKAILLHPEVSPNIDRHALRSVLQYRAVYGDRSMFTQVKQVRPGSVLVWTESGFAEEQFFNLATLLDDAPEASLEDRVLTSVGQRLVADVPVGAFLSGGIDSSIIVAAMHRLGVSDLRTFSVSFDEDPHDEHSYAASVASRCGAQHTRCRVGSRDFVDRMEQLSFFRDGPLSEPADVAVSVLSETAKRGVKVVLSGEGADEAFAGYPKYSVSAIAPGYLRWLRYLPHDAIRQLCRLAGSSDRRYQILLDAAGAESELEGIKRWFAVGDSEVLERLYPGLLAETSDVGDPQTQAWGLANACCGDRVQRMQYVDLATWLPGNLLERGDRMSMANGLEVRMPFMSRAIQGMGLRLPISAKIRWTRTKLPLRQLASRWVGPDIGRRRKWGFRVPLESWFRGELGGVLRDYVERESSAVRMYGSIAGVRALLDQHATGERDWSMVMWTLLTIEAWQSSLRTVPTRGGGDLDELGPEPRSSAG